MKDLLKFIKFPYLKESNKESDDEEEEDEDSKPHVSFHRLVRQAIKEAPNKRLTYTGILNWFVENYSYYKKRIHDQKWKVN